MSNLVARCPQCHTAFRVTQNQLIAAKGAVRCGSCLTVFKAVDHQAETAAADNTPTNASKTSTPAANTSPETTASAVQEQLPEEKHTAENQPSDDDSDLHDAQQNPTEELIDDSFDDDEKLDFGEDIYDLNTNKETQSKKVNLFDIPKRKPMSKQSRESADESWALDMLAELQDDDDIEPLNLKTKLAAQPETTTEPEPPEKPQPQSKTESEDVTQSISAAPNDNDELLDFDPDACAPLTAKKTSAAEDNDYISEAAIDNAMHTRTHYAGDQSEYLARIEPSPVEMVWQDSSVRWRWLWRLGALLTGALIIVQLAVFRFDSLAKNPTYRPYYASACALLGCQLPNMINIDKIRTTNLIVRSHPTLKHALITDAILINTATFEQAYPILRLEFSDLNNQLVAARNLQPQDYLAGELAGTTHMPINQPIQVSLEIVDPGDQAINYQLNVIKTAGQ